MFGYGMGYYGIMWDPTYILVMIGMVLCLGASALVNSTMSKYSRVRNMSGVTGAEAARRILNNEGLYNVQIECLRKDSGDHYDPRTNTVRLSYGNYNSASVTAVGVAAHECGHAIQHANGYAPLVLRSIMVPVANIGSRLAMPLILLGIIFSFTSVMGNSLITFGILLFGLSVLFTLITLPVEFNASRRAIKCLESSRILYDDELAGTKKVLSAAAMTYVASAAVALANFIRLIVIFGGRRRD